MSDWSALLIELMQAIVYAAFAFFIVTLALHEARRAPRSKVFRNEQQGRQSWPSKR